jgi:integrase
MAKRKHNGAHPIRPRSDGTPMWRAIIYGPQESRSFTVPSGLQKDADIEAERIRVEMRAARATKAAKVPPPPEQGTIGELAADWMADKRRHGSPSSVKGYRGIVKAITDEFGAVPIGDFTRTDARDWYNRLTDKGMSLPTLGHYHAVLRGMLSMAVDQGKVKENVTARMKLAAGPKPTIRLPKDAQLLKVLAGLSGDIAIAARLAAACGLRRGELCALRWSAIQGRQVVVTAAYAEGEDGVVLKSTKTNEPRKVTMDAATMRMLAQHRRQQRAAAKAWGHELADDWFVLADLEADPSGQRALSPSWLSHAWQAKRGKLKIGLHGLRHWYASRVIESGKASIVELSSWLGHAQVSTTLNMYTHADPERAKVSAQIMGPLLGNRAKGEGVRDQ